MGDALRVSIGQHSDRGRKPVNQDFHGATVPPEPLLGAKGVAVALADGIGSSDVSQIASEFAVMGFLDDYYCTSETWSVKKSAERVVAASNSWLHSRSRQGEHRYDRDKGYVCTLSALVVKSATAHLFHVGDSRIHRLQGGTLELLTRDHRVSVSENTSYLSRAVGFNPQVEIDYLALPVEPGDVFVLTTDGVHEHVTPGFVAQAISRDTDDLDAAARAIVAEALGRGSPDNLTVQIVRIDAVPLRQAGEIHQQLAQLPLPPLLEARAVIDGYRIVRELHGSSRSHIYLAVDTATESLVVLKTPSIDLGGDAAYLERFMLEEWVARRIDSAHVLKPQPRSRERRHLYVVTEYIEGQTLAQWMIDHPAPDLETVRGIVEQIARGLQAFHRLEMLHQDLRPQNVMIDRTDTVKIIDFGATHVAGVAEMSPGHAPAPILGTVQYTAPEYFLGEPGSERSDLFSLGVMTYQMLSGTLPYGTGVAQARSRLAQSRLRYRSVLDARRDTPQWIDRVLQKATQPNPQKRHETLSEFVHDLRQPGAAFLRDARPALIERHPVLFWKSLALLLAATCLALAFLRFGRG